MAIYRLRHRYHRKPDRIFEAADDREALKTGRRHAHGSDYALRCGDRCVALIQQDCPPLLVAADIGRRHFA